MLKKMQELIQTMATASGSQMNFLQTSDKGEQRKKKKIHEVSNYLETKSPEHLSDTIKPVEKPFTHKPRLAFTMTYKIGTTTAYSPGDVLLYQTNFCNQIS